ncbi:MAG: efflux RND transporter periplasmic adaptor subunit [Gammaproteobacteria bacterium]
MDFSISMYLKRKMHQVITCLCLIVMFSTSQAQEEYADNFDCLIEPKMTVKVGAPTQGIIDSVNVSRSQIVEQGQILATLKANVEKAAMKHSRARATMKSEVKAREADLSLAQINMDRIDKLSQKKIASQQQRDEAFAQLKVAQMSLLQAKDNMRLYEMEYQRDKSVVEQHVIRSPISGVVVEQLAYPGEFVYENPIMVIAQLDPLSVEAILPTFLFGQVEEGMQADVIPEINTENLLKGKISTVDRLIDTASGTFSVYLELANPSNTIPAGQRCTIEFQRALAYQ